MYINTVSGELLTLKNFGSKLLHIFPDMIITLPYVLHKVLIQPCTLEAKSNISFFHISVMKVDNYWVVV